MLSVTNEAQAKIREVLPSDAAAVRLQAIRGPHGCIHGWKLSLEETLEPTEVVFDKDGVKVVAGRDLSPDVAEATIDYREDSTGIGFTVDVPGSQAHGHAHGEGHGGCGRH